MAGYALMAVLALLRRKKLLVGATLIGLGYSLYLTHIEKNVLMVWCLYCVISLGIVSLITLLSLAWLAMGRRRAAAKL